MTYLEVVFDEALLKDKKTLAPGTQLMAPDPVSSRFVVGEYTAIASCCFLLLPIASYYFLLLLASPARVPTL